jgi:16S rRNA (cytosine967-C5)-methyltransferase
VLKLDAPADKVVSAFFREHRHLGPRERHTLAETAYTVLRQRLLLQHLAQSGSGALERRLAILAGRAANLPARRTLAPRAAVAGRGGAIDRASLPEKLRHNLPDWLAAALREIAGRRVLAAGARAGPAGAAGPARQRAEGQARRGAAGAGRGRHPPSRRRFSPWGLRVQGKPALQKLDVFTAARSRCRTRAASCWRC